MKHFTTATLILAASLFSFCDEATNAGSGDTAINLSFTASEAVSAAKAKLTAANPGATVEITDFLLSIEKIKFDADSTVDTADAGEVEYEGPYVIDLVNDSGAPLTQALGEVVLAPGTYKVIRMVLHKDDGVEEPKLLDRSIYIAGTVDGTPFQMWHDTSENLDVESVDGFVVEEGALNNLEIDFQLGSLLSNDIIDGVDPVDITAATDDNNDSLIEIERDEINDNNGNIADALKERIKIVADIIKEEN